MPKGLSAGDGGLTQPRSTSVSISSFPQFSSKVSESKLYTPTIEQASIPETAQDQEQLPDGEKLGDIIYWDPEAEDEDGNIEPSWVILTAPDPNPENPKYIKFKEELEWVDAIPDGNENNEMLVWDGLKWNILSAPSSGTDLDPSFLQYKGDGSLVWDKTNTLPDGSHWGDLLYWDPDAGDNNEGDWVVLDTSAAFEGTLLVFTEDAWGLLNPQQYRFGSIMYWDDDDWNFVEPPETLPENVDRCVLTYKGDSPMWEAGIPNGNNYGDLLYWDPQAGDAGAWVTLDASQAQEGTLLVFTEDAWGLLDPSQYKYGSIMYWDDDDWAFLEPPTSNDLHVLSIQGGELGWIPTQDCET